MQTYKVTVDDENTVRWYNEKGQLHREDGPALELSSGDKEWCKNGQLHREDGPAIEYSNGDKVWYKNGQLHREDGPAVEYAGKKKEWYLESKELRLYQSCVQKWLEDGVKYYSNIISKSLSKG